MRDELTEFRAHVGMEGGGRPPAGLGDRGLKRAAVPRHRRPDGEAASLGPVLSVSPWTPRSLRIYGSAELLERDGQFGPGRYMRITPAVSWSSNLDGKPFSHDRPASVRRTVHREP